jgi:hypothetical protein
LCFPIFGRLWPEWFGSEAGVFSGLRDFLVGTNPHNGTKPHSVFSRRTKLRLLERKRRLQELREILRFDNRGYLAPVQDVQGSIHIRIQRLPRLLTSVESAMHSAVFMRLAADGASLRRVPLRLEQCLDAVFLA